MACCFFLGVAPCCCLAELLLLSILYQVAKFKMLHSKLQFTQKSRIHNSASFLLSLLLPLTAFSSFFSRTIVFNNQPSNLNLMVVGIVSAVLMGAALLRPERIAAGVVDGIGGIGNGEVELERAREYFY